MVGIFRRLLTNTRQGIRHKIDRGKYYADLRKNLRITDSYTRPRACYALSLEDQDWTGCQRGQCWLVGYDSGLFFVGPYHEAKLDFYFMYQNGQRFEPVPSE